MFIDTLSLNIDLVSDNIVHRYFNVINIDMLQLHMYIFYCRVGENMNRF